ncbi:hydrogenase iron-sulfur subunit [Chloroflexota bacterium]
MSHNFKPVITIFHCVNAFSDGLSLTASEGNPEVRSIQLPCSSMVKYVYLLRAYEAGADAVVVLTCPEGECKYVDGNIRARKRVERLQSLLDEIGLDSRRLSLFNISPNDKVAVSKIIQKTVSELTDLGPNPVAGN